MPRAGLTTESVVTAAAELADEVGLEHLTLAALAGRLGVRLPSLYKHVDGLPGLRRLLTLRAKRELAALSAKATAGKSGRDALFALATAYAAWARAHPGAHAAASVAPAAGDEDDEAASQAAVEAIFDALHGYGLEGDALIDAVRSLRALIHGFVTLERAGGFALDRNVDASLAWALESLHASMTGAD